MIKGMLVDAVLKKYGLPPWMKSYVREYIKGADAGAIKYAMGFIKVGRKKGAVQKETIKLPNGKAFRKEQMLHLLSLCYYYEDRVAEISRRWATAGTDHVPLHDHHFLMMADVEQKRARAIKNLINSMAAKASAPNQAHKALFDYIESLHGWNERIVAKRLILNYSFRRVFGLVFYRSFYPVSPEFMRSFGKVFHNPEDVEKFGEQEAERVVQEGLIGKEQLVILTENLLGLIARAIDSEANTAKAAGVEREVALLKDIALAYPLHRLNELGVDIDVKSKLSAIKRSAKVPLPKEMVK